MCPTGQRVSNCVGRRTPWALSTCLQPCCRNRSCVSVPSPCSLSLTLSACLPACLPARLPARLHLSTTLLPGLVPEGNDAVDPDEAVALGAAVQVG